MNFDGYKVVYTKYFRLARKIANDIIHDYHLAGDVAQEVFTEMIEKLDKLDDESKIKYWVTLNANRRAVDYIRKPYHQHEMRLEDSEIERVYECRRPIEPEEAVLLQEEADYRKSALEELKDYNSFWYDLLMRYYVEEESYQSLALAYGVKVENLRVQTCRARKWLDDKMYELYGDDY